LRTSSRRVDLLFAMPRLVRFEDQQTFLEKAHREAQKREAEKTRETDKQEEEEEEKAAEKEDEPPVPSPPPPSSPAVHVPPPPSVSVLKDDADDDDEEEAKEEDWINIYDEPTTNDVSMSTLLVGLLAACCYINTLFLKDMLYDDHDAIVANKDVRSDASIADVFSNDFWGESMQSASSHNSYRPLTGGQSRMHQFLCSLNRSQRHSWPFAPQFCPSGSTTQSGAWARQPSALRISSATCWHPYFSSGLPPM
jgi:hypothetical protein